MHFVLQYCKRSTDTISIKIGRKGILVALPPHVSYGNNESPIFYAQSAAALFMSSALKRTLFIQPPGGTEC